MPGEVWAVATSADLVVWSALLTAAVIPASVYCVSMGRVAMRVVLSTLPAMLPVCWLRY